MGQKKSDIKTTLKIAYKWLFIAHLNFKKGVK